MKKIITRSLMSLMVCASSYGMDRHQDSDVFLLPTKSVVAQVQNDFGELVSQQVHVIDHLKAMGADKLHQKGFRGEGIKVGVVAFAYDYTDPTSAPAHDAVMVNHVNTDPNYTFRIDGHENRVANIIAGSQEGFAPHISLEIASYMNPREFPNTRDSQEVRRAQAFKKLADHGCDVIVLSFGLGGLLRETDFVDPLIKEEILKFTQEGGIVFNSGGNNSTQLGTTNYTADKVNLSCEANNNMKMVVAVETNPMTRQVELWHRSNKANNQPNTFAAFGTLAIPYQNDYYLKSGTSYAAPVFAGGFSLLKEALQLPSQDIFALLTQTAKFYNLSPQDVGSGLPDLYQAYKAGVRQMKQASHSPQVAEKIAGFKSLQRFYTHKMNVVAPHQQYKYTQKLAEIVDNLSDISLGLSDQIHTLETSIKRYEDQETALTMRLFTPHGNYISNQNEINVIQSEIEGVKQAKRPLRDQLHERQKLLELIF